MSPAAPPTADRPREAWTALHVVLALAAAAPALGVLWLIVRCGVNTPFWDQWGAVSDLVVRSQEGSVGFFDLWAQYNESRKLFPRLVILLLARATGWDVRYEMGLSLVTVVLTSLGLYALIARTTDWSRARRLGVLVLVNLLLFSLVQHRNWLWGIQLIMFVPPACLVAALVAAAGRGGAWWRVAVCVAACTVATYSFANGMVTWLLVLPALVLAGRMPRPHVAAFCAAGLVAILVYFAGYETPHGATSPLDGLARPRDVLAYLLEWLGAPLGTGVWPAPTLGAIAVGAALLCATALCIVRVWRSPGERALLARAVPWLCLAGYPVASGLVTALSRSDHAPLYVSRYTTVSLYLAIATVVLVPLVLPRARRTWLAAAAALVLLHAGATVSAYWRMRTDRARRLQGKACLAWVLVAPEYECLRHTVSPRTELLAARVRRLAALGMLDPPPAEDAVVTTRAGPAGTGELVSARREGDEIVVSGWAELRARGEPADAVLLCLDAGDGPRVVALAWQRTAPGSTVPVGPGGLAAATGWVRRLPVPGEGSLTAWAYDALAGVAHPLAGALEVRER